MTADNWKLVPSEPDWAMQIAGRDAILSEDDTLDLSTDDARAAYKAMYAASPPAPAAEVEPVADLEEAIRLAEVGEYLYSSRAYSYGDGYTEPREYGIDWQWQQSKPGEYGQGRLLADAVKWHEEQAEDGTTTEAAKLRAYLSNPLYLSPVVLSAVRAEAMREALEAAAKVALADYTPGYGPHRADMEALAEGQRRGIADRILALSDTAGPPVGEGWRPIETAMEGGGNA